MALFIDTNVPIYARGSALPLKEPCREILRLVARSASVFVTDAEVLQELLHRYMALQLWDIARQAVSDFAILMRGRIQPILASDVESASVRMLPGRRVQARDLVHAAVMARLAVSQIVTADRGFDEMAGIERLDPLDVANWAPRFGLR